MRSLVVACLGLVLLATAPSPAAVAGYPPRDARYHSYPEMVAHIKDVAATHPDIVRIFSIGRSYQGRKLWAAEVSDRVGDDEGEPEVLFDGLQHAREHLSGEMTIAILDLLAGRYGEDSELGRRVTRLVDRRRIWIVFMLDPDGLVYDISRDPYRGWRKNRQPTPRAGVRGTDLNRNWGYRFGCCGGSSGSPTSQYYRGLRAWSAPEVRALRDFVLSRRVGGVQRIRTHISFHAAGELVLWPYAYTRRDVPPDMTALDERTLRVMGRAMAKRNGYRAGQSSAFFRTDGDTIDWMYAKQRIFSYTFELYPRGGSARARWYPPDEIIGRETRRNRDAILYLMQRAGCPYAAIGAWARRAYCGPFFDDLEVFRGWQPDPDGSDTASDGRWQRGDARSSWLQLADATSGRGVLVTGRARGHDVDGGRTTMRSRTFRLPENAAARLRLRYWVGLGGNAAAHDGLRIRIVDATGDQLTTVLKVSGQGRRRLPKWRTLSVALPSELRGREVAIELVAVDAGANTTVEAGVDDVRVTVDG